MTALAIAVALPAAASADTNRSSNWAGYAVHRSGVTFTKVGAVWTQPSATCQPGFRTYSAYWVGIGGYSRTSEALEQIGTEVDCSVTGQVRSSAWYELVPAASRTIRFTVHPGDLLSATVKVVRHRVVVTLTDATTKRTFRKVLHARVVDASSADWIVEAPSDCVSDTSCQTLPLADFGSAAFTLTYAQTAAGHHGSISDSGWSRSRITLVPGGRRFVAASSAGLGEALPSTLNAAGNGFSVSYAALPGSGTVVQNLRGATVLDGQLVHLGR